MGVAILHPRDCLNDNFSRNNLASSHRHKKPLANRRRRSPPRHQPARSPPPLPLASVSAFVPKVTEKKNLNHTNKIVSGQVKILKRGEDIGKKIPDMTIEQQDLKSIRQIGSDPKKVSTQIRIPEPKSTPGLFYAGPVTSSSPPPSDVPLPAFFSKKRVSLVKSADATNDLIRILRLDIE